MQHGKTALKRVKYGTESPTVRPAHGVEGMLDHAPATLGLATIDES